MILKEKYFIDIANRVKGKKVLDAGCCASTSKNLLKRHNHYKKTAGEIIGVDINKKLLKEAKEKLAAKNVYYCDLTNNENVLNVLERFGTFEAIISTDVIEHIGNLTLYLDNLYRLLDDNGRLYITTPNMLSSVFYYRCVETGGPNVNPDHVVWFDITTLKVLLDRSKFKIEDFFYYKEERKAAKALKLKYKDWMCRYLYLILKK